MPGITLPENLNMYISAALFVLGAYLFALYAGLVVWTWRDIRARSRDVLAQIMATLLVMVFTLPGLVVYLLLRPHTTLAEEYERSLAEEAMLQDLEERHICPQCRRRVAADFVFCPYCHHHLKTPCAGCSRLLNPAWDLCPYCGLAREPEGTKKGRRSKKVQPAPQEAAPQPEPAPVVLWEQETTEQAPAEPAPAEAVGAAVDASSTEDADQSES